MTLLIIIFCIIVFLLIKYWIKFVNLIFNSFEKYVGYNPSKKAIDKKQVVNSNFGEFTKKDFPKDDYKKSFCFYEYLKMDGEWVNEDEPVCEIKISYSGELYTGKIATYYAGKSGFLEHTKTVDDLISENEVLFKIHDKGIYKNENSIEKSEFKHYLENHQLIENWFVKDGDYVKIDENIYQYNNSENNLKNHKAEKEGYIDICDVLNSYEVAKNTLIYIIREDDTIRINQKFKNEPKVIVDDFTNSKIIKWKTVSTTHPFHNEGVVSFSDDGLIDLLFSFNFYQGKDYIIFHFNPKQIKPKLNDKISFLFENNKQIDFLIDTKPISSRNSMTERIIEYKSLITESELGLFANQKFKKWKISLLDDDKEILGGKAGASHSYYQSKSNLIIVINKFAKEYIELVKKEIDDYKPTEIRQTENTPISKDEFCYVYLMHDTSNQYYKIGISNNPKYREHTLQSEKPTIELLVAKKFPIRKIAESIEKALHDTYSEKRIRGEWFDLTEEDVEHIKESLE